jgi:dTDP-4-dehydrorhamnose reductase
MNIYYTAKDIEELVAKGIHQLELGPNTSLTDFARETAEQLDVTLLDGTKTAAEPARIPSPTPASAPRPQAVVVSQAYNKPRGCQTGGQYSSPANIQASSNTVKTAVQSGSAPVNKLVDLMGKIIKRGE